MPLSIRACRPISPRSYRAGLPPVSYEWMSGLVSSSVFMGVNLHPASREQRRGPSPGGSCPSSMEHSEQEDQRNQSCRPTVVGERIEATRLEVPHQEPGT